MERYDGSRREGIGLFQTSIRDVILAPHAERVRRIEDEIFWSRVPEQIRVWIHSEQFNIKRNNDMRFLVKVVFILL